MLVVLEFSVKQVVCQTKQGWQPMLGLTEDSRTIDSGAECAGRSYDTLEEAAELINLSPWGVHIGVNLYQMCPGQPPTSNKSCLNQFEQVPWGLDIRLWIINTVNIYSWDILLVFNCSDSTLNTLIHWISVSWIFWPSKVMGYPLSHMLSTTSHILLTPSTLEYSAKPGLGCWNGSAVADRGWDRPIPRVEGGGWFTLHNHLPSHTPILGMSVGGKLYRNSVT